MPKKRGSKKDLRGAKPKQLHKRLRKAEDQLQNATAKRDRAQARVEALAIIADELRAQLAELERSEPAAAPEAGPTAEDESTHATKRPAGARTARGTKKRAKSKEPAAAKGSPAADGPAAAEEAAGASSS
jgi:hypothetical protein